MFPSGPLESWRRVLKLYSSVHLLRPQWRDLEELQVGVGERPKLCSAAYHVTVWKVANTGRIPEEGTHFITSVIYWNLLVEERKTAEL